MKILSLAAFAPAQPSASDYNVRVYFLEDTQDAFEVPARDVTRSNDLCNNINLRRVLEQVVICFVVRLSTKSIS